MRVFISKDELRRAVIDYFNGDSFIEDIGTWDTSQITDMSKIFLDIRQISVNPITLNWNTSNGSNNKKRRVFYLSFPIIVYSKNER